MNTPGMRVLAALGNQKQDPELFRKAFGSFARVAPDEAAKLWQLPLNSLELRVTKELQLRCEIVTSIDTDAREKAEDGLTELGWEHDPYLGLGGKWVKNLECSCVVQDLKQYIVTHEDPFGYPDLLKRMTLNVILGIAQSTEKIVFNGAASNEQMCRYSIYTLNSRTDDIPVKIETTSAQYQEIPWSDRYAIQCHLYSRQDRIIPVKSISSGLAAYKLPRLEYVTTDVVGLYTTRSINGDHFAKAHSRDLSRIDPRVLDVLQRSRPQELLGLAFAPHDSLQVFLERNIHKHIRIEHHERCTIDCGIAVLDFTLEPV